MNVRITPSLLHGTVTAPPSKSMAHRHLICAALADGISVVRGVDYSEDILATMDCMSAFGAKFDVQGSTVTVDGRGMFHGDGEILDCRESGSTLRFLIPLALCCGRRMTFAGKGRLMERPMDIYEDLCREKGFVFTRTPGKITVCGHLTSGEYVIRGDISSQFISGMIFALATREGGSTITILPPFESRSYVLLTLSMLAKAGIHAGFTDEYHIRIPGGQRFQPISGPVEGDYSNAAFLDAFGCIGGQVQVTGLSEDSLQGDRVYKEHYPALCAGTPEIDMADCPDLGPVLMALAALKNGAVFTNTARLAAKESDRGAAMAEELARVGVSLICEENRITVPGGCTLHAPEMPIDGHNDHRIVMAMAVVLSQTGGEIVGAEAVRKSYPGFFADMESLGGKVEIL
ncbi:MAG: 3-phosphoshikimate 1-carboxyvinyltransferase [Ruminococcaceae bacterium]|nr:3-phosphoshikimate 1-carboxyvinyltransferase [Oscillospiraceae bacterium]